ncbi:uncharacterized protein LOC117316866 isoform X2 [Pecten maximus]|uniref:uncharacterized protein LOC117316866 isoform X2 n=1 Tax=Pecten maximus TaxID=6579 RepID=UPI0014585CAF|nr:uncharacterized protein LOC117316866 isoform X2 [Pecten maximus]
MTMCCKSFKKLILESKILITVTGLALCLANILQVVGIVSPEWDIFDTPYFGSRIRLYQNLWTVHDEIKDKDIREGLLPKILHNGWKAIIVRMELSALGTGVLALFLVIATASVKVLSRRRALLVTCYVLAVLLTCSSVTTIFGAQTYKKNYKSILSVEAFNPKNMIPVEKYVLSWGLHVCYASGTFYILSSVLIITNIIKDVTLIPKSAVSPSTSRNEQTPNLGEV